MFGLGGKYVEVFQDVRFAVPPLTPHEAGELVRGIRGFLLLAGVRGEPPADLDVLVEVLLRLAQLTARHPAIRELDVNPFLAAPERGRRWRSTCGFGWGDHRLADVISAVCFAGACRSASRASP